MSKQFKDTLVGKFLIDKGLPSAKLIGNLLPSGGVLGLVKNIISTATVLSDSDKKQAEDLINQENELFKEDIADTQDARKMQIAALNQNDIFIKRFVAYLSIGIIGLTFSLIVGLYFIDIPKDNQSLIYMALGVFIGGFTSSISFWLGTSHSSSQKQDELIKMIPNK